MGTTFSTYYSLVRVRELGPEAKDWAATDSNVEKTALLLKSLEQHTHTGTPLLPKPTSQPALTEVATGGSLAPGTLIGVRLSYVNAIGLETDATTEFDLTLAVASAIPLAPILQSVDSFANGLSGGTYMYVFTKSNGSGETTPSDALPVTIPYDQTYSTTLQFDAIDTYTDGTTQLNVYRSAGLNSSFQLVTQITDVAATTFTDTNVSQDQTTQPPSVATFDRTRKVTIDWSTLVHPSGAVGLKVYVTQQSGVWGNEALLETVDLTAGTIPTSVDYLGSETLDSGYPLEATQIPTSPAKIDLATQTTGGFSLTADGNFNGHQAKGMVLDNTTSPSTVNGTVYYDPSINNIRAYINGTWVNWGSSTGSAYTHPNEEVGGHLASHVRWKAGSASPTVADILGRFTDVNGNAVSFTRMVKAIPTTNTPTIMGNTPLIIPEMTVGITNSFNGQLIEVDFQCIVSANAASNSIMFQLYWHETPVSETFKSIWIDSTSAFYSVNITFTDHANVVAGTNNIFSVYWWTGQPSLLQGSNPFTIRSLTVKALP